jgi:predicted nuclease of predicted toxin-antitoxin system
MARLYADEQFPRATSEQLQSLGHDVLTVQAAGNAGDSDPEVLDFARLNHRIVITQNRRDFIRLHRQNPEHSGIVICTTDQNSEALAERIDRAIRSAEPLDGQLVRVVRPG